MDISAAWTDVPYGHHYVRDEKRVGPLVFRRACVEEEGTNRG